MNSRFIWQISFDTCWSRWLSGSAIGLNPSFSPCVSLPIQPIGISYSLHIRFIFPSYSPHICFIIALYSLHIAWYSDCALTFPRLRRRFSYKFLWIRFMHSESSIHTLEIVASKADVIVAKSVAANVIHSDAARMQDYNLLNCSFLRACSFNCFVNGFGALPPLPKGITRVCITKVSLKWY